MATLRQKMAVEKIVGNGGNVTEAMREVGYTENTANTPQKLTESKGFKELMAKAGLDDDYLLKRHKTLLDNDDYKAIASGLNLAYKAKGYLNDQGPVVNNIKVALVEFIDARNTTDQDTSST
jgi:hypothetical protein